MPADADRLKRDAANAAVERFVESGATLGLGSGSTSAFVVGRIGEKLAAGELRFEEATSLRDRLKELEEVELSR